MYEFLIIAGQLMAREELLQYHVDKMVQILTRRRS